MVMLTRLTSPPPPSQHLPMSHLLSTAPRLANSGLAEVTFKKSRGLIVPPGAIRILDAAGKPSGPVILVSVEEARLADLPPPPRAAFQLGAACAACGNAADRFKCPICGQPFCGHPCFKKNWKVHRAGCRQAQARRAGEESEKRRGGGRGSSGSGAPVRGGVGSGRLARGCGLGPGAGRWELGLWASQFPALNGLLYYL